MDINFINNIKKKLRNTALIYHKKLRYTTNENTF